MRLKKFFAISSLLLLSACLRPAKPIVEACHLDGSRAVGICGLSGQGGSTSTGTKPINQDEPLGIDKSTCFPPTQWKLYKTYVDLLEAYVNDLEKNCH